MKGKKASKLWQFLYDQLDVEEQMLNAVSVGHAYNPAFLAGKREMLERVFELLHYAPLR